MRQAPISLSTSAPDCIRDDVIEERTKAACMSTESVSFVISSGKERNVKWEPENVWHGKWAY